MHAALTSLVSILALPFVCLLLALASADSAANPPPALPEGNSGIASRYPGDAGIEKDPAVIFHEDFEECRANAGLSWKWDAMRGRGRAAPGIRADVRKKCLANLETNTGAPADRPSLCPLFIYIYRPEQRDRYGDGFFADGTVLPHPERPGDVGPSFVPRPNSVPETDRRYCFEYMVQANTPGQRDGRVAYWMDGKLAADFPNLRLRDVDILKIDRFDIGLYIAKNSLRANTKWGDDIVAATSHIGPRVAPK